MVDPRESAMTVFAAEIGPPDGLPRFMERLAHARTRTDVVDAVRGYLADWPAERVLRLQRIDAGWAPFDLQQHPSPLAGPTDLHNACDAVQAQCAALSGAGVEVEPELAELAMCLSHACRRLDEVPREAAAPRPDIGTIAPHA